MGAISKPYRSNPSFRREVKIVPQRLVILLIPVVKSDFVDQIRPAFLPLVGHSRALL